MIESIFIKNYRNIEELELKNLKPINLITGKNNTGKTSLLEAFGIMVSQDSYKFFIKTAMQHSGVKYDIDNFHSFPSENNIKILSSLFKDRYIDENNRVSIQTRGNNSYKSIDFYLFEKAYNSTEEQRTYEKAWFLARNVKDSNSNFNNVLPLGNRKLLDILHNTSTTVKNNFLYFVESNINFNTQNSLLFDKISLTHKEKYVIEALHIIEPTLERIAFVDDGFNRRKAMVRLSDTEEIVPLESMGDGINRILTIILSLLNAENGYLLIDEVENGLHYSVQEDLWKIIFYLSEKLNIQVLATTHSNDCISSFENVLNDSEIEYEGKLIRLDNKKGKIVQVDFDKEELKIATDQNIEIR
ncbi:AAA family ATPase [Bernardetia sp. MNP-M8]|uniref:AAA family ATPase n=1 Tax=Bernardetia sp. MNP-M8 TaxID=3127470 RepID=UPI0030CE90DB